MIYVWAAVIAISLIVEFATQEFVSIWFAASGVVSLSLAFCKVSIYWQIPVFIIASLALIFATRPLIKKFIKKDTLSYMYLLLFIIIIFFKCFYILNGCIRIIHIYSKIFNILWVSNFVKCFFFNLSNSFSSYFINLSNFF